MARQSDSSDSEEFSSSSITSSSSMSADSSLQSRDSPKHAASTISSQTSASLAQSIPTGSSTNSQLARRQREKSKREEVAPQISEQEASSGIEEIPVGDKYHDQKTAQHNFHRHGFSSSSGFDKRKTELILEASNKKSQEHVKADFAVCNCDTQEKRRQKDNFHGHGFSLPSRLNERRAELISEVSSKEISEHVKLDFTVCNCDTQVDDKHQSGLPSSGLSSKARIDKQKNSKGSQISVQEIAPGLDKIRIGSDHQRNNLEKSNIHYHGFSALSGFNKRKAELMSEASSKESLEHLMVDFALCNCDAQKDSGHKDTMPTPELMSISKFHKQKKKEKAAQISQQEVSSGIDEIFASNSHEDNNLEKCNLHHHGFTGPSGFDEQRKALISEASNKESLEHLIVDFALCNCDTQGKAVHNNNVPSTNKNLQRPSKTEAIVPGPTFRKKTFKGTISKKSKAGKPVTRNQISKAKREANEKSKISEDTTKSIQELLESVHVGDDHSTVHVGDDQSTVHVEDDNSTIERRTHFHKFADKDLNKRRDQLLAEAMDNNQEGVLVDFTICNCEAKEKELWNDAKAWRQRPPPQPVPIRPSRAVSIRPFQSIPIRPSQQVRIKPTPPSSAQRVSPSVSSTHSSIGIEKEDWADLEDEEDNEFGRLLQSILATFHGLAIYSRIRSKKHPQKESAVWSTAEIARVEDQLNELSRRFTYSKIVSHRPMSLGGLE